ncbi:MAG TPA: hydroxymethylbilane synthase [Chthoniobacterales bacterium]
MGAPGRIVLGSRGSELALTQARMVEQALRSAWPGLKVATEIVRTSGDEASRSALAIDRKAGRKGLFTREIEKELLVRRIDVAIHSAKDLPSERVEELEVRASLPRANTEDILVTKNGASLTSLPAGATIATGSIRRQRQLGWQRPDLEVVDLRGNVPTRLRKLHENKNWSGIILARAGLERLALSVAGEILAPDIFVAAGGQGVIALQTRRDDEPISNLIEAINHQPTHVCLRAEREFLRLLGGDCDSPVGVQARLDGDALVLRAQIFETDRAEPRMATASGRASEGEAIAKQLMAKLYGG